MINLISFLFCGPWPAACAARQGPLTTFGSIGYFKIPGKTQKAADRGIFAAAWLAIEFIFGLEIEKPRLAPHKVPHDPLLSMIIPRCRNFTSRLQ